MPDTKISEANEVFTQRFGKELDSSIELTALTAGLMSMP